VGDRPPTEAALVERARRGDTRAYAQLIDMHQRAVFRAAYLITGNEADAADAVQEAFVRAFRALGRFRRGAPFRPWVTRIAANEARDRRDAQLRFGRIAYRAAGELPAGAPAPSPESELLSRETLADVVAALDRLSERDRMVIAYRYFLELSESEMAVALDCPRGTVKSRLSRALENLRGELRWT
jgi:RNA polymerase sigma factor (sigma-70 family)